MSPPIDIRVAEGAIVFSMVTLGLLDSIGNQPGAPTTSPEPARVPEASRPQFDLVIVSGADSAFLTPNTGVERVYEGVPMIDESMGFSEGGDIVFIVDPDTDYQCLAMVGTWFDGIRSTHTFELPRTWRNQIELAVYRRIRAERTLATTVDALNITDAQLARAVQRMNARINNEGDQK